MAKLALAEDAVVLIGRAHPAANDIIQFTALADADFPNLPELRLRNGVDAGAAVLKALGVTHVHVQHLADLDPQVSDFVTSVCSLAGLAYDVTLHDYMSVCPRLTLIDGTGRYCGEPSEADCEACVQRYGSPFGKPLVWNWRARHERFLAAARMIFVPSEDQAARMARFSPRLEFVVRPHPESATQNDAKSVATRKKRKARRIGILGAIGPQKGSVLISEVVKVARIKQLDLEFAIIGYSDRDAELRSLGVEITGAFQEGEAPKLLQSQGVDLVWFASVCPETYSYALSDAIRAGVMPVAFDLGAIGERIRKSNWGHLLDLELMLAPEAIAEALATIRIQRLPAEVEIRRVYTKLFSSYYGLGMS